MNWDRVQGNWKQLTGKVKEQWGKLTDDELTQINGNREQFEGKIQAKYGYAKDKANRKSTTGAIACERRSTALKELPRMRCIRGSFLFSATRAAGLAISAPAMITRGREQCLARLAHSGSSTHISKSSGSEP